MSIAFDDIIKVFEKQYQNLTIMNFAEKENGLFDKLLLKNLKDKKLKYYMKSDYKNYTTLYVTRKHISGEIKYGVNESAILLFDSVKALNDFNDKVLLTNFSPKSIKLFVYCHKATVDELKTVADLNIKLKNEERFNPTNNSYLNDMNDVLQYQYFFVEEAQSIKLMTFVWYTQEACHIPQLIEINRFHKKTAKWKKNKFSVEKCRNFQGCEIIFGAQTSLPEIDVKSDSKIDLQSKIVFGGYVIKMIRILSEALNYTCQFNSTYHNSLNKIEGMDIADNLRLIIEASDDGVHTQTGFFNLYVTELNVESVEYFAAPPGTPYDAYEKLYIPFDWQTWIWTMIVFFATFVTIFIVYRMKIEVQDFIFGTNVSTPSLNVLAAFFGISQNVVPTRNFARFLVMIFILYSFMIRTLYQGGMCDYLQSDMRRPKPIQSAKDIKTSGFDLYIEKSALSLNLIKVLNM
jgi:hypothetical protein